jgi:hypothetical protein
VSRMAAPFTTTSQWKEGLTMRKGTTTLALAVLFAGLAGGGLAFAQPPAASGAAEAPKVKVERGAGGKTVYRIIDAIHIDGKIQKPEAFYVLQKSSINYDWQELRQDFIPKILDSVSRSPF